MNPIKTADDLTSDPQEPPAPLPVFIDPPQNAADKGQVKKKAVDDKIKALQDEGDLRTVLSTQQGIRFVARLLGAICYIDQTVFSPNNSTMCNIAGRRQIGLELKNLIRDADFELWVKVDRELEASRPKPKTSDRR